MRAFTCSFLFAARTRTTSCPGYPAMEMLPSPRFADDPRTGRWRRACGNARPRQPAPNRFRTPPVEGRRIRNLPRLHGHVPGRQGIFTAHDKGDHWEFALKLASRGLVDDFYPFTGSFWCLLDASPTWRSVEYGEFRFEPKRTIREQTKIDYAAHQGTREIWTTKDKPKKFTVAEDSVDDVGTMLYHLRACPWKVGDLRVFHVYESDSEKEALAECDARETRAIGVWPAQPLLHLTVLPGKGTHHRRPASNSG